MDNELKVEVDAYWAAHKASSRKLGRRMRHWLRKWCKQYLEKQPDVNWVRVEIEESEEHFGLFLAAVSTDDSERDERAQDELFEWAAVIKYGVPAGSWVRVTREGKVYRDKRKEAADGD